MAKNGKHALASLPLPEVPNAPVQDKSDAAAQAVAAAAIVVCRAIATYRPGPLDPAIKCEGGATLAVIAAMMLDSPASGDAIFIDQARREARRIMQARYTDDIDPAAADKIIDIAIDGVLEIAGRVAHDERIFRLVLAN